MGSAHTLGAMPHPSQQICLMCFRTRPPWHGAALFKKHPLERGSSDDMERELKQTLANAAGYMNRTCDVEGLHSSFPERLAKHRKRHGDRLAEH